MAKFEEVLAPGLTIRESANDGSDFTNPTADYRRLFLGEDGQLHVKDAAGTVTDIGSGSGAVATDAIWDAAGDLALGTGANTASKLTVGATGKVPSSNGTTLAYVYPPRYEFDRAVSSSQVTITGTTEGAATTVITGGSFTAPGSVEMEVEFFIPRFAITPGAVGRATIFVLLEASTVLGRVAVITSPVASQTLIIPIVGSMFVTPASGARQYILKAFKNNAGDTVTVDTFGGGSGTEVNGWLRVVKA